MSRRIRTLISTRPALSFAGFLLIGLALGLVGCDADSPSEPSQPPGTPPGSGSGATYSITVTATPSQVPAGSTDPVQVRVRVLRQDTGQPPPTGTTIVVAAGAGSFGTPGGPASIVLETVNGQAAVSFFPPADVGTGTIVLQARLEESIGQTSLQIVEPATFFVASIQPSAGSPNGGDAVTIQGGGFETPVRVTFGGVPAQVQSVSSNRIQVITPPSSESVPVGGTRTVDVSVTVNLNEPEQATDVLPSAFTFSRGGSTVQPQVFSVTPAAGPNEGGTRVTITGEGFQSPVQVFFGEGSSAADFTGIEASVQSVTPGQIVVTTPSATGFGQNNLNAVVDILVKNLQSGFATVAPSAFQYGAGGGDVPFISAVSGPGSGPHSGGTILTIHGQGFDAPVAVTMGGVGQTVTSVTATQVVFRTSGILVSSCPDDGREEVSGLTLTNIETNESASADNFAFDFLVPSPRIAGVSPGSGPQGGGTAVTISGENFEAPVRVELEGPRGGPFSSTVTSTSSTSVGITTPAVPNSVLDTEACDDNADGTPGERFIRTAFDVQVENTSTGCSDTFQGGFTYIPSDRTCRNDVGETEPDPVECEDGFDNDGDGLIDEEDPECTGPGDDDESA